MMKRSLFGLLVAIQIAMFSMHVAAQNADAQRLDMEAAEQAGIMRSSEKPFAELVAAIEQSAAKHTFSVLQKHNIQESLQKKGFALGAYTIIEVCNGKYAHTILSSLPAAGMFLPCRIAVYDTGSERRVVTMKPSLIREMMPGVEFGTIPEDVEKTLVEIIEESI